MAFEVEQALNSQNRLGEGPLWSVDEGRLYWVDILDGTIQRATPGATTYEMFSIGQPVGSMGFRASGGFILALRDGLAFWHPDDEILTPITDPEAHKPQSRFNDGAVDPKGRFWAGTTGDGDQNFLYRLDPDLTLTVMETGVICSNGIGWSPDHRRMYYSDSEAKTIYIYDYDVERGEIEHRRVYLSDGRYPDGLTVDSEGGVWIAFWNGACIERRDPDGKLIARIEMPVQYPTCPIFGGVNMDEVFVTSASEPLGAEGRQRQPVAGNVFRIAAGVKGIPEPKFAG